MVEENERRRVLEEAIRFETDGREFFLKAAEKAKTYFAKVIFQIIAEEELDHIRKVKQIYESDLTSKKQGGPSLTHSTATTPRPLGQEKRRRSGSTLSQPQSLGEGVEGLTSKKSNLQNVFQEAKAKMGQNLSMNADEMEAIRLAVQLEFKGQEFYERLAEEATSDFEKAFYQHLAQEESVHFSILRQMEDAVRNATSLG